MFCTPASPTNYCWTEPTDREQRSQRRVLFWPQVLSEVFYSRRTSWKRTADGGHSMRQADGHSHGVKTPSLFLYTQVAVSYNLQAKQTVLHRLWVTSLSKRWRLRHWDWKASPSPASWSTWKCPSCLLHPSTVQAPKTTCRKKRKVDGQTSALHRGVRVTPWGIPLSAHRTPCVIRRAAGGRLRQTGRKDHLQRSTHTCIHTVAHFQSVYSATMDSSTVMSSGFPPARPEGTSVRNSFS